MELQQNIEQFTKHERTIFWFFRQCLFAIMAITEASREVRLSYFLSDRCGILSSACVSMYLRGTYIYIVNGVGHQLFTSLVGLKEI